MGWCNLRQPLIIRKKGKSVGQYGCATLLIGLTSSCVAPVYSNHIQAQCWIWLEYSWNTGGIFRIMLDGFIIRIFVGTLAYYYDIQFLGTNGDTLNIQKNWCIDWIIVMFHLYSM